MIEALAPGTAEKPLADSIQIRRPRWNPDDLDTRALGDGGELLSELAVVVPDQVLRSLAKRCHLPQLLRRPAIAWSPSHADVHDLAGLVAKPSGLVAPGNATSAAR